jgi:nicotinamide mononucleotide transporter
MKNETIVLKKTKRTRKTNVVSHYFSDWNNFEKIWLGIFTLITIYLFFAWQDSVIGLIASLTGMITVVLVAKGKISNYYFGIVNILAYAYVSYHNQYYGEVMLNLLYFLPLQFVGLYYWMKHKVGATRADDVNITTLSNKERLLWVVASIVGIYGYTLFLEYLGGSLPLADSLTTVLSIVAMILLIKRAIDQWVLWIIIDVVAIGMWAYRLSIGSGDITILVMWIAFLVNAVYGLYNWIILYKKQTEPTGIM